MCLSQRVWENQKLTTPTKMAVYRACIISTLLYGSESWTTYAAQEKLLNVFHLRCLRHILSISWQDRITNSAVLERAGISSVYTLLRQKRLRWIGHVHGMDEGRIPKQLFYGELVQGKRPVGRPKLGRTTEGENVGRPGPLLHLLIPLMSVVLVHICRSRIGLQSHLRKCLRKCTNYY